MSDPEITALFIGLFDAEGATGYDDSDLVALVVANDFHRAVDRGDKAVIEIVRRCSEIADATAEPVNIDQTAAVSAMVAI